MSDPVPAGALRPRPMTLEEWAALDEDEPGELVDGWLTEDEVPDLLHEAIVSSLNAALRNWGAPRGALVAGSGVKLAIREGRGRMADLVVHFPGRHPEPRGLVRLPPDLAVEVISPTPRDGRRDRVEKLAEYASIGIRWYWLVDRELRTLEVLELGPDGRYAHALSGSGGTVREVPGCAGLVLDLDALWREADALLGG